MDASPDASVQTLLTVFAASLRATGIAEACEFADQAQTSRGPGRELGPARVDGCRYLDAALAGFPEDLADAARAVRSLDPVTDWREAPHHAIPEDRWWGHAYAELVGPDGHFDSSALRLGLYVQAPSTHYAAHAHGAEEFYMVLSGVADWQAGDRRTADVPSGTIRHHPPHMPHATITYKAPLLALWGWRGDIGFETYRFV